MNAGHKLGMWMAAAACVVLLASCHHHRTARGPRSPKPASSKRKDAGASTKVYVGYAEQGNASWYGVPYHGRPAADGEIYNMETLVAAHRLMPFNTWLRVTNLKNQKTVEVRVIDRGPFVDGRIIDLSKAAARQIDLLGPGVGPVRLEVIAAPADVASNDYYGVQVGAFTVYANAERARTEFARRYGTAQITARQGTTLLYRVLAGKERTPEAAQKIADELRNGGKSGFVVRLDETVTGDSSSANPGSGRPEPPPQHP